MNLQVTEADVDQLWCSSVDGVVSVLLFLFHGLFNVCLHWRKVERNFSKLRHGCYWIWVLVSLGGQVILQGYCEYCLIKQ